MNLILLALLGVLPKEGDLSEQFERARNSGSAAEMAAVCSKLESALAEKTKNGKLWNLLVQAYLQAGVLPLVGDAIARGKQADSSFVAPQPDPGEFTKLEEYSHTGELVRVFRSGKEGPLYFVGLKDNHYSYYYRAEGKALYLKIRGFGPLRVMGRLESPEPAAVRKVVEAQESVRAILENAEEWIQRSGSAEKPGALLTDAAKTLAEELKRIPSHLGLLEELSWVYDRLGEVVAATSAESEYRRPELVAARNLAEAAGDLPAAHAALALAYFRLGAYPLASVEAVQAKENPIASDLLEILKVWSQDRHERIESFEIPEGFTVESFRTKSPAPENRLLFGEITFIVRRAGRPEFVVYTLTSQKLKERTHYSLYTQFLADRTLLITYADTRPDEAKVKEQVVRSVRKLAEKKAENPKKEK